MLPEDVRRINEWQTTQYDDDKLLHLVDIYHRGPGGRPPG